MYNKGEELQYGSAGTLNESYNEGDADPPDSRRSIPKKSGWGLSPFGFLKSQKPVSPPAAKREFPAKAKDCSSCERLERELKRIAWELREREALCRALAESNENLTNQRLELSSELESLSQALFMEANRMVADERRRAHSLTVQNVELTATLERTKRLLQTTASAAALRSGSTVEAVSSRAVAAIEGLIEGEVEEDGAAEGRPLPNRTTIRALSEH
ncbi:hypothetical protein BDZ88DRAFT_447831 [Geranomyces variabilis]|nr:hypothetical protein BDZ88DRAFT_447831 [Geranomyces variabilis]